MSQLTWEFPYPSQRMPVFAKNIIAASQPLAAQAGLGMMIKGGNAVDAVIAAAITLTVVEPVSNGLGSDAFALVWDSKKLNGLNSSGRSPKKWNINRFAGMTAMPSKGWDSVTVPGAVKAWAKLSEKFGILDFEDLFKPAIEYAQNGFIVSPIIAKSWADAPGEFGHMPEFAKTFLPRGRAPLAGEIFSCPDLARTLEQIAESKGESFYKGKIAEKIADCAKKQGGVMTEDDLAKHKSDWVEPISTQYNQVRVHEIPPNGQGLAALIALGILRFHEIQNYDLDSCSSIHLQIEAMKIGFSIAHEHISDPASMKIDYNKLLDDNFLEQKAKLIDIKKASIPGSFPKPDHGTVYLTAADKTGIMVSYIQSNYAGFGSGVVIPGTGISLQNRGSGFCLDKNHPNCAAGNKRPYHTIIPGFVTRDGYPLMSFGVMGAHMQPQGHVQMITRIFDYQQNPQAASDAPRWHVCENGTLAFEKGFDKNLIQELENLGHRILGQEPLWGYGGAQIIYKLSQDFYCAASDHRKDGQAVGF
ncbi:Putative Gamma glutamyltranspeptidase [Desulfonema limicola]|uniref:Gamma glutamyltranspeptidase n=1 Tax=Desulfonema limicola TaxID=45656 RepID=A0A975B5Y0_9BACT|nr:gamma-glutamyltransferase family protein [Desulfonema limicola]QTA79342.1 Putative Gamma glutamyltranspeptidase [Desulfonema limicola]